MAVEAYIGLPGSGKSYGVVENVILPALQEGRKIVTNMPLNAEKIETEFPGQVRYIDNKDVKEPDFFDDFEAGATLVLDEVWRFWSAGTRANNIPEGHKEFFAEHRHLSDGTHSTQIILITQDLSQIATFQRNFIDTTYQSHKLDKVGQPNKYRIDVFPGHFTGPKGPEKDRLRQMFGSYKPEVYAYYKSQTKATGEHSSEAKTDDRANLLNSWFVKFGIPGAIILAVVMLWLAYSSFSGNFGQESEVSEQAGQDPNQQQAQTGTIRPAVLPIREVKPVTHFFGKMRPSITFNARYGDHWLYRFKFQDENRTVTLDVAQLGNLGYQVRPVDECLAEVTGKGDSFFVFCEPSSEEVPDAIPNLADAVSI